MAREKEATAHTPSLTAYFGSPPGGEKKRRSTASSTNSSISTPARKRKKADSGKASIHSGQKSLGEVTLSDSDQEGPARQSDGSAQTAAGENDEDDEDLVIVEPVASTSKVKVEETVRKTPPKVAAIFALKPRASATPQKPPPQAGDLRQHALNDSPDRKPDVRPSPSKNIAVFDTAAATSSCAAGPSGQADGADGTSSPTRPLDTSLFSFDPSSDISFGSHTRIPFSFFTDALLLISSTRSRLYIQLVLTNLLRTVIERDSSSLVSVIYLCSNRIGPSYEPQTELGIGWRTSPRRFDEKRLERRADLAGSCPQRFCPSRSRRRLERRRNA